MKPLIVEMQAFGPFAGRQVIDFSMLGQKTFFLIHGPTGAGKTSILDAMSYALFGDSSGGEREGSQMRSHHADRAMLTQVRFEFSLGDKRYRVVRMPEQIRPALRGGGETKQKQKAELHRLDPATAAAGPTEVPLATDWTKVTQAVVELLGFSSKQFLQVIMLPQGQFFEFLKSKSDGREEILKVLFGTEIYSRIEAQLTEQAKLVDAEAAVVMTRRETLFEQAQVADQPALDERLKALAAHLEAAQTRQRAAGVTADLSEVSLASARQLDDRFAEFDKAGAARSLLQAQEADIARRRSAYEAARAAATVEHHVMAAHNLTQQMTSEAAAFARLEAGEQAAAHDASQADSAFAAQSQRAPEQEALSRRLLALDEIEGKVLSLHEARLELAQAGEQSAQATSANAIADKARQAAIDQHARVTSETQAQQLLAARQEGLKASVDLLQGQAAKAAALASAQTEAVAAQRDQVAKAAALETSGKAEALVRTALDALLRAWKAGQAVRLAEGLTAEHACPVCGSAHHPAPAHLRGGEAVELVRDDALASAEETLRSAESAHRLARQHHDDAASLTKTLQLRIGELRADLGEVTDSAVVLNQKAATAKRELEAADAAAAGLSAAQDRVAAAHQAMLQAQAQAAQSESTSQAAQARLQHCQTVLTERAAGVPPELAAPAQLAEAREQALAQQAAIRTALETASAAAVLAGKTLANASAQVQATRASLARLNQQLATASLERDERLKSVGFDTLVAFEAASMASEQLAQASAELQRFDTDLAAADQRLRRATADVQGQQRPDMTAVRTAHEQAKDALIAASNAARDALGEQQLAERLAGDLRNLAADYERLQGRYGVVKRVADLASGKKGQRMSFQRYVLSTLLEEVLAATTQRLQVMSKGRYELRRAGGPGDKRSAGGLELESYDHYTGTLRPVTTLSGGESFLTSLALALGLSDVVQSHAGGIRLDAIFVDEGFGTLDTESLEFAIQALKNLQQSGRMVGIISHVTELREWIDARLEVTAGVSGSRAEFVV